MDYAIDRLYRDVYSAIVATDLIPASSVELGVPAGNVQADLAFPTFRAAKGRNVSPDHVAQELAASMHFGPESLVAAAMAVGPYVNFTFNHRRFVPEVLTEVNQLAEAYGSDTAGVGKVVLIDYSSPNVAKRMHVGHIRSTIIGQALVNILTALGYQVIRDNHLGDWGKSFGVLLTAIAHEGLPSGEGEQLLVFLEDLYARYSSLAERDPSIDEEARAWSLRLEQEDHRARELWQQVVDLTIQVNQPNYDRLGIQFDHVYGESFYESMLAGVIEVAEHSEVASRDESGALVIDVGDNLPTFLLQKSDGGTLYHTRDMATIQFRVQTFHPDQIIYVIGVPQELYLQQLFALARALGIANGVDLIHVPFGTVFDENGQALSTRRGNMVYLETLLNEAHIRARAIVDESRPDLPGEERDAIAEAVGIGAVIYNDLRQTPKRNITLDWDRMLALKGDSAPYVQYMYARCQSIRRRAAEETRDQLPFAEKHLALLVHQSETDLVKQLARLPIVVRDAGERYAPHVVAEWCYETARRVATFYRDCPVLHVERKELRAARLELVSTTAQALKNGLHLLGISVPNQL